ncbi:helix-turn-helix domain-containing protein [Thermomonospora cellulosilytica]|uniref:AraC family chemosensory pili system transcriptional regulator ChpD n=1 Tax=Thermomonospora cellulosilytica TaxID=1411118 RepID=A0A7W3N0K9_9ACTN|nr:AraC family transcriptional regulator [Thermomonospora cellulosilytica]MBA9005336.1 AraC family chemosensory pili system transcriptional regulator ChpD [Thermomonospora cellulosilytica]
MQVRQVGGGQVAVVRPASGGFARHSHDEYVISVNLRGLERVRLDGSSFEVGTEEVTVYNPGQVQSCTTRTPDRTKFACVSWYVPPSLVESLTGGARVDFERPALRAPHLRARLLDAARILWAPSPEAELAEERLTLVLLELLDLGARPRPVAGPAPGDARIVRVLDRLRADLSSAPRLAELADEIGMSREHLVRSFTRAMGSPPYAWHLQARLAEGRRRLRRGEAVAAVAHDLGFADQAHSTGTSPPPTPSPRDASAA